MIIKKKLINFVTLKNLLFLFHTKNEIILLQTSNLFKTCKVDKRKECYTKFTLKYVVDINFIIEDSVVIFFLLKIVLINISIIIRYSMAPVCNIFYLLLFFWYANVYDIIKKSFKMKNIKKVSRQKNKHY